MPDLVSPKIRAVPSCIPQIPVYYETFSARNFNTSPLTISGLKGDSYDYTVMCWVKANASSDNVFYIHPNGDTTSTNKRRYFMRGYSTTANASVNDSADIEFLTLKSSSINMCICEITGDSSDERYLDIFQMGENGAATEIRKTSGYWKNTADELTSIEIKNNQSVTTDLTIAVFATPKDLSENWTLIDELSWTSETTEKTFSGLDGDVEKEYLIEWRGDQSLNVEPNNDGGTNYTRQYIANSGGTISAANTTGFTAFRITDNSKLLIYAESGVKRLAISEGSRQGTAIEQFHPSFWWSNTADNITSLACAPFASGSGTAKLWKKKNPDTVADKFNLPFKMLKEVAVSGDFSAGHTFSGLTGDSVLMYKLEFIGDGNDTGDKYFRVQFNSDTGSNYTYQWLSSYGPTAAAASGTTTYTELSNSTVGSFDNEGGFNMYLFPQSGENRPLLFQHFSEYSSPAYMNQLGAGWWNNTADEITSIKIYMSNTSSISGTLKLSYIPLPE